MNYNGLEIAIIGMAGKFPGADSTDDLWKLLMANKESISFFSDDEIEIITDQQKQIISDPNFIKAKGIIDNVEYFDAAFFGYTPNEAMILDPQVRLFHECAWSALEDAGYSPLSYPERIGVYCGAGSNPLWEMKVLFSGYNDFMDNKNKDHLSTRLSYKFNLNGPSNTITTACSTSLVSVHAACRSILGGECDIAIAGGASIELPQKYGYLYKEGLINSSDGHVRTFDENASGTVFSDGLGVVVLKSLEEAIKDGDNIHAVIKGTAINNDGNKKVSYSAPSVQGQTEVIKDALYISGVRLEEITYIETHGTATKLGDSIEIEALKNVSQTNKKQFCGIGSLKPNIGHLNIASGIAGLIKTILILKNKVIPASINCDKPIKEFDIQNSPFYIVKTNKDISDLKYPVHVGVSSFGVGGTNVHAILEEAPKIENNPSSMTYHVVLQSAKTVNSLENNIKNLVSYVRKNKNTNLPDVAYTLSIGRENFEYRKFAVCSNNDELIKEFKIEGHLKNYTYCNPDKTSVIVFLFPGQGTQYLNMAKDLFEEEPIFRTELEKCFQILESYTGESYEKIIYPETITKIEQELINETNITQLLVFIIEYSLCKFLIHIGITPNFLIGHSIGEYVAACIADVFTLEDAIKIVHKRGILMNKQQKGAMLSIALSESELEKMLPEGIEIATVNSSSYCTVSGPKNNINDFHKTLNNLNITSKSLKVSHAFHSYMMDSILNEFEDSFKNIKLNKPKIPFISNLSGQIITNEQATSPSYWTKHLRGTVQFEKGIRQLLSNKNTVFIEIGPNVLSGLMHQHKNYIYNQPIVNVLRNSNEDSNDQYYLLKKLGDLWSLGIDIKWQKYYSHEKRLRISLPTYTFDKKRFWIDGNPCQNILSTLNQSSVNNKEKRKIDDWFYVPAWKQVPIINYSAYKNDKVDKTLLLFEDEKNGKEYKSFFSSKGYNVIIVKNGKSYSKKSENEFIISPTDIVGFEILLKELKSLGYLPDIILYAWPLNSINFVVSNEKSAIQKSIEIAFYGLLNLCKILKRINHKLLLNIITSDIHEIIGNEKLISVNAISLAAMEVISQEFPDIDYKCIDLYSNDNLKKSNSIYVNLFNEIHSTSTDKIVAYRNDFRNVQVFEPISLKDYSKGVPLFRENGTYLITGGSGKLGLFIAEFIAKKFCVNLVLLNRNKLPDKSEWKKIKDNQNGNDRIKKIINTLIKIESYGSTVNICSADVGNLEQLQTIINEIEEKHKINGVIHAAGLVGKLTPYDELSLDLCEEHFNSKIYGLLNLDKVFENKNLDFFMVTSSLSSVLGGMGLSAYASANSFMDYYIKHKTRQTNTNWITINWDNWFLENDISKLKDNEKIISSTIVKNEGYDVLEKTILYKTFNQIIVSVIDINNKTNKSIEQLVVDQTSNLESNYHQRPNISIEYKKPRNNVEESLAKIWQNIFKYDAIGVHDDFFELGGDSLQLALLNAQINKTLGHKISIADIYKNSTIHKLSNLIRLKPISGSEQLKFTEKKWYYPLSSAQDRMYSLYQLNKQNLGYNFPHALIIEGNLNIQRLEQTFHKLIARHEILRTSIKLVNGKPMQKIDNNVKFKIKLIELNGQNELEIRNFLKSLIVPFDLDKAPLLNVALATLKPDYNILFIDKHHLITDAVSQNIFIKEIVALYQNNNFEENNFQYKDYSNWQNKIKTKERYKKNRDFWLNLYKDNLPKLDLPYDFERGQIKQYDGNKVSAILNKEIYEKIKKYAKKNDVTIYMVLLASYGILLSKYSNQEDIAVGSSIAGRSLGDFQNILGMFVNTLPLRLSPKNDIRFEEYINNVKSVVLNSIDNQEYQFNDLVADLRLQGIIDKNPLYDVVFEMHYGENELTKKMELEEGLSIKPFAIEQNTTVFDLILIAVESVNIIELNLIYSTNMFTKKKIERMSKHLVEVINQFIENPNIEINQIVLSHELVKSKLYLEEQGDFSF